MSVDTVVKETAPAASASPTAGGASEVKSAAPAVTTSGSSTLATSVPTPVPVGSGEVKPAATTLTPAATPAVAPAAPAVVEAEYKLTLPEGSMLDPKAVDAVTALAKETKLSPDAAKAVLNFQSQQRTALHEEHIAQVKRMGDEGVQKLRDHKEFGGVKYAETCEDIKRAATSAFPELAGLLKDSPLGNHYELNLGLARIGKMMRNDKMVLNVAPPSTAPKSNAQVFYGK